MTRPVRLVGKSRGSSRKHPSVNLPFTRHISLLLRKKIACQMRNTKVESVEIKELEENKNFFNHSLPMESMDTAKNKRTLNPIRTLSRITRERSV
uniref:Uncharacterized protein n=1 Tax=Parascaris univalens TaxID=6257 RepID=A0A914ZSI8_PARUN